MMEIKNEVDEVAVLKEDKGAIAEAGKLGVSIQKGGIVFAVGILLAALILVIEVIMRYVFNAPTLWAHETVIFLCACAFIYGGLYSIVRDDHIRVVLLYDRLSGNTKKAFDVFIYIACAIACTIFSWAAWQSVKKAIWTPAGDFRLETSGSAWNPPTPGLLKIFLFIILSIMAVQYFILAVNYARERKAKKS